MSSEDKKQHDAEVASLSDRSSQSGSETSSHSSDDEDDESDGEEVNIDLSNNEFYKGMCTLLEDENGNNIVQYVDLLCDETKEIADSVKNLEHIRRDIHSIAKNFERFIELQEQIVRAQFGNVVAPPPIPQKSSSSSHHHSDDATHKSSKKEHRSDEQSVRTSKSHKSKH